MGCYETSVADRFRASPAGRRRRRTPGARRRKLSRYQAFVKYEIAGIKNYRLLKSPRSTDKLFQLPGMGHTVKDKHSVFVQHLGVGHGIVLSDVNGEPEQGSLLCLMLASVALGISRAAAHKKSKFVNRLR